MNIYYIYGHLYIYMYTHTLWFLLGICFKSPYKAFRRYPCVPQSLAISLVPMSQAKEVMPGFPSSRVVHLVCPCERKRMIIYNLQTILFWGSILAFALVICRRAWRWLEMLGWLAVCIPWKHTLKVTFCIQTLAWNTSAAGEAQVSRSLLLEQTPKGASKINVPKENREVPIFHLLWPFMNLHEV